MMQIKLSNVTKSYTNHLKKKTIFKNLNFVAEQGDFTLITGKSGSGKSTLLNILALLDQPDSGKIEINSHDCTILSQNKRANFRAKNIGFVFQSYALIPELSIMDNCTIPLMLGGEKKAEAIKKAEIILENLFADEYKDLLDRYPKELSGGQQQRVSIARALIHEPSIIIADEPTGNLDNETAKIIKKQLKELSQDKCIIVVSHDITYSDIATKHYVFEPSNDDKSKSQLVLQS